MNVSLILIILLVGAFATYFAGDKLASKAGFILWAWCFIPLYY
jgi:NADH-quinone oxidoreductase subunit M